MSLTHTNLQSIGKQLMAARVERGLAVEDIAFKTYIPASKIRELENDDFSNFANLTYAKGFLKIYSNYLDLDLSDYLDEFNTSEFANISGHDYIQSANTGLTSLSMAVAPDDRSGRGSALSVIILLAIAAIAVPIWYWSRSGKEEVEPPPPTPVNNGPAPKPRIILDDPLPSPAPAPLPAAVTEPTPGILPSPSPTTPSSPTTPVSTTPSTTGSGAPKVIREPEIRPATPVLRFGVEEPASTVSVEGGSPAAPTVPQPPATLKTPE